MAQAHTEQDAPCQWQRSCVAEIVLLFRDRRDAGRQLAQRFDRFAGRNDVVVLALPRGGVPVGYEIAIRIAAPLDALIVRELGVPGHDELAYPTRFVGSVAEKIVIVVDDGSATGSAMAAAIDAVRKRSSARVILAVPVAPPETCRTLGKLADAMVCLVTPDPMYAVGVWYETFTQTSDDEVRELLDRADADRRDLDVHA